MCRRAACALYLACSLLIASAAAGEPRQLAPQVPAAAQQVDTPATATICNLPVPPPARLPPADSGPVVYALMPCFDKQGGSSVIDPQTYLHYIQLRPSQPSLDRWVPYNEDAEKVMLGDFRRLWNTNFLDDLSVELVDYRFENGVIGKVVVYNMEERQRVKIVDYEGLVKVDQSKIEDALKEKNIFIRLDSFVDESLLRRVTGVVRDVYASEGYQFAEVSPVIKEVEGGTKLVHVTFNVTEGPRVKIYEVEFLGNEAVGDRTLARRMKENKQIGLLSFITGGGTYKVDKYEEDAQHIVDYYRDRGYIMARVGQPDLRPVTGEETGGTRWVQLRIPVTEGKQYRVGDVTFDGNTRIEGDALRQLFKLKSGEVYSQKDVAKGLEKAREIYGAGGYYEFTAYPDLRPRDQPPGSNTDDEAAGPDPAGPPIVDVVMRIDEGKQYYVNRISFVGNTTTRDEVIRREMNLVEAAVFNTEALKYSVRRLNQLGYFKPIEGEGIKVEKTPHADNKVDVELKIEEQNRNQVSFGAGTSQYDGFFGNASFTTSNFMGRGETLTLSAQVGARASNYQLAFTEPFIFGKPITGGFNLFSRKVDYLLGDGSIGYSEVRSGASLTAGMPVRRFTRLFATYAYEVIDTAVRDELLDTEDSSSNPGVPSFNPFLDEGRHIESSVNPTFVYNTVDSPFMPRRGMKVTANFQVAGSILGGTTDFLRPEAEAILYVPHTSRTAFGLRANIGWVQPYGQSRELPYYLRFFLGGETQIRGVDIRTVGPTDSQNRALGGNKFVLFNAEYYFDVVGPVRALLFHDAGQAFAENRPINLRELRTSSGAELRVLVPVLSVPIRLIYSWNVYRDSFQPARAFRFAVGTSF